MNDTNADRLRTRSIRAADHDSANTDRGAIEAAAAQHRIETPIPRILLAATVRWPHSRNWGYAPSGLVGVVLVVLLVLFLMGRI